MTDRGWILLGLFALFVFELTLRALLPDLAKDDIFKWAIEATWNGGLVVAVGFYFVASKKDPPA